MSGAIVAVNNQAALVAGIVSVAFAMIAFLRTSRTVLNGTFTLVCAVSALWNISDYINLQAPHRVWFSLSLVGGAMLPALLFHFVWVFVRPGREGWSWSVAAAYALSGALAASAPLAAAYLSVRAFVDGPAWNVAYFAALVPFLAGALVMVARAASLTPSPEERERLLYVLAAAGVQIATGLTDLLQIFGAPVPPLGHLGSIVTSCVLAIGLRKYRKAYDIVSQVSAEHLVDTVTSLAIALEAKSSWTKGHSERVAAYSLAIGTELRLPAADLERLRLGGLLHDIGKFGTLDVILDKKEGLAPEELERVKRHPLTGAEILRPIRQLRDVVPIVRSHHERLDGKGYPEGLRGDEIPFPARVVAVADGFDSMAAARPYRPALDRESILVELRRSAGVQFDPAVVDALCRVIGKTAAPAGL